MTLAQLAEKVGEGLIFCQANNVLPSKVHVSVWHDEHDLDTVESAEIFENDDEPTYREHLSCGGDRELDFCLEVK